MLLRRLRALTGGARCAMLALLALSCVLALMPTALALDVFPGHETLGATEARFLVRLPEGGKLVVSVEPAADVALVEPGARPTEWKRAPATFVVERRAPEDSWHGLPGTVEVVVRRGDPLVAVRVDVEDDSGSGAAFDWPAQPQPQPQPMPARRGIPPAPPLLALLVAMVGGSFKRGGTEHPSCDSRS